MMILKKCWQRGIEPFLFFGELNAHRIDGASLTEPDRIFTRMNKTEIIEEIRNISSGTSIDGDEFFKPFLEDRHQCGQLKKKDKNNEEKNQSPQKN